jgi:hypothetical protein
MKLGTTLCGVLAGTFLVAMAIVAEGVVVTLGVDNLGPSTWPAGVPPVLPGFTSYRLRMVSDGGPISGIDLSGAPERGIFGALHQRWGIDSETGEYTKSEFRLEQNNANSYSNDSHFLFDLSMIVPIAPLEEDNPGTGSPRTQGVPAFAFWGVGTKLRAAFGIVGQYQSTDTAFAYLVVPDDRYLEVHGWAQVAVADSNYTFDVEIVLPEIPEPASLSLLALGSLALLRRRRA